MIVCSIWPIITIAVGVISWWASHRFSLRRDIRKEWNAIVEKIRPFLDRELKDPSPDAERPSTEDINRLEHMLAVKDRAGYRKAVDRYEQAHDEHTYLPDSSFVVMLSYYYRSTEHIEAAIRDLLAYMPYK